MEKESSNLLIDLFTSLSDEPGRVRFFLRMFFTLSRFAPAILSGLILSESEKMADSTFFNRIFMIFMLIFSSFFSAKFMAIFPKSPKLGIDIFGI